VILKRAADAGIDDLLHCSAIAIGTPEYFGTMAGMIKDFFDRTYEAARERTIGLPFVIFVCAGNDGRGAINPDRTAGRRLQMAQSPGALPGSGRPTTAVGRPRGAGPDPGRRGRFRYLLTPVPADTVMMTLPPAAPPSTF